MNEAALAVHGPQLHLWLCDVVAKEVEGPCRRVKLWMRSELHGKEEDILLMRQAQGGQLSYNKV